MLNSVSGPNKVTAIDFERPRYVPLDAVEVSFLDDQEGEKSNQRSLTLMVRQKLGTTYQGESLGSAP